MKIGIIGSGAMGAGIAQVAATANHEVVVVDTNQDALKKAQQNLNKILDRLVEKEKINQEKANEIYNNICFTDRISNLKHSGLIIEAIIENLDVKQKVFKSLEGIVEDETILASNTSSLSIAALSSVVIRPENFIGIHFFNPAPLMPLVEIIPSVNTSNATIEKSRALIDDWGKTTVLAKDTPGFIVNRVARPFYGEALRIYEEGIADFATIDWAMTELGGFKMGPFTLMDYIGNDVNYTVTETVFKDFYYDPRYKPSFTQKRMMESGRLGRKSGKGFYDYSEGVDLPQANEDIKLGKSILNRIVCMLINEAADALYYNIASREDIDLAMVKGVNYPKGLLKWADEIGLENVLNTLSDLHDKYNEDRYRPSLLLKQLSKKNKKFYE